MQTQRCPGIRLQLDALPALRIGEEAEAALVHPLHQNHAHAGPAVRSRGGQSCGVGIVRFAALRLLQPVFEECDWILRLKIHGSMVACDSIEERSGERFHVDGRTSAGGAYLPGSDPRYAESADGFFRRTSAAAGTHHYSRGRAWRRAGGEAGG